MKKIIWFRAIAIASAVVLTVLMCEAMLWLFFPLPFDREIKVQMSQNLPGLSPLITYERNALGLRSLSLTTRDKPPGTYRILCLGASTTDQATQNTADTWSGQLEILLNKHFAEKNLRIEVGAYGRGGDKILHRFLWAVKNFPSLDPDLVILLEGVNDICSLRGPVDYYPGFQQQLKLYEASSERWETLYKEKYLGRDQDGLVPLRRFSQLARRFDSLQRNLKLRMATKSGAVLEWHSAAMPTLRKEQREMPFQDPPVRKQDPIQEFADGLAAMTSAMKADGISALVMSQPTIWKPDLTPEELDRLWFWVETPQGRVRTSIEWLTREMARYNALQKQIAEKYDARFLDLAERVPRTLDMFFDDCHFTDEGSRYAAEIIFPVVKEIIEADLQLKQQKEDNQDSIT